MPRKPNPPSANQRDRKKFLRICTRIRLAGMTNVTKKSAVSHETIRKYLNGITISALMEIRILNAVDEILMAEGINNDSPTDVADKMIGRTAHCV